MKIGVLHGPNLQLLGQREPEIYGTTTLAEIDRRLHALADELGVSLEVMQSNHEGRLLDWVASEAARVEGFLVNAAAFTHTSLALADALAGVGRPFVEVHLSNTAAREEHRRRSFLAPRAAGVVYGFGPDSYLLGLRGLVAHLNTTLNGD